MKVAELLELRRKNWQELERLCDQMGYRRKRALGAASISRFAALYRAACADLALADAYHLPPNTVQYLHRLVGRAHNQLYRSRTFDFTMWGRMLFVDTPQRIFGDRCIQFSFCLFWGVFILSAILAHSQQMWPNFAVDVLGEHEIEAMEQMFADFVPGRDWGENAMMASFYISHNTGIGLQCFVGSLLVLPGLLISIYNAMVLGASFGYMFRPEVEAGANFRHFVTAHGPFELTAIVLSAGTGLRIGMSWISTRGFTREGSLVKSAHEAMPMVAAMGILFFCAALIEGFVSPSSLPYWCKALIAILSTGLLLFYFIVLGFPWSMFSAARQDTNRGP